MQKHQKAVFQKKHTNMLIGAGLLIILLLAAGCDRQKTVCTPEVGTPKPQLELADLLLITPEPALSTSPVEVEIGGRMMKVDKLVNYPVCNDDWSGTVYMDCDAQVAHVKVDEDGNLRFFEGCDLNIESGTVIYVAAHNDAAYYKGCSCHTGEDPIP